jgi:hypothetical protein
MGSSNTDASTVSSRAAVASRLKPRLSARAQFVLAGLVWYAAAIVLGVRGVGWLVGSEWALVLAGIGLALGLAKARFAMMRVASRAIDRIRARDRDRCGGGFFSWQAWLVVVVMMAAGHALRLTSIPRPALGVLYVAISVGLIVAGWAYWRAAASDASNSAVGPGE